MISIAEWHQFDLDFFCGKFPHQRYGQALLNQFHSKTEVAAVRGDFQLWEAKTRELALNRAKQLGILE